jgi:EAL domain-containing protein (putative c-di-GMP-specific phosphodiesterase class I)
MVRLLISRSVLFTVAVVGVLVGISILRLEVGEPGIMLLAVVPITLLGVMFGARGGLAGAAVASAVFLVWALTKGHPGVVEVVDEPVVFLLFGFVAGIYARGALGDFDPRAELQRADLRRGIRSDEVVFVYQPLALAGTGRVVALEALARWEHPDRGRIEPGEFIPLAERDERTIWELTVLAVNRALADLSAWGDIAEDIAIWVNLSSASLGRPDLAAQFSDILTTHGLPPSRLALEVTESAVIELPQRAANALDSLAELGVRIVLDDFGTGHSSISRLGGLPFDALKVDLQSIALPPERDPNKVMRGIIDLAHALGLQVVAERVEDDDTWESVHEMGCDLVQGFGLSPPLTAAEARHWLQHPGRSPIAAMA